MRLRTLSLAYGMFVCAMAVAGMLLGRAFLPGGAEWLGRATDMVSTGSAGYCGDGAIDQYEACDDANNVNGDGWTRDWEGVESGGSTTPACGNGIVDPGEVCDGGATNGAAGSCCSSSCSFKTGGTVCRTAAPGGCDATERCSGTAAACPRDGKAPAGTVCNGGVAPFIAALSAAAVCNGVDNTCPVCGNGVIDSPAEECDGTTLGGQTCQMLRQGTGGDLRCTATCRFDISSCGATLCGNGRVDPGEQCEQNAACSGGRYCAGCLCTNGGACGDGSVNSASEACDRGTQNGQPGSGCSSVCTRTADCGNGMFDVGEQCDRCLNGFFLRAGGYDRCNGNETMFVATYTCEDAGFTAGTLGCSPETCRLDTSQCTRPACGNGRVEDEEQCDGNDLQRRACTDFRDQGYAGGQLRCNNRCEYDFALCTRPVCGNTLLEAGEECDSHLFNGVTCEQRGFPGGGALNCNPVTCRIETNECSMNRCGNGIIDRGEQCDKGNAGRVPPVPPDLEYQSCVSKGFPGGGTLGCSDTCQQFDTSRCIAQCGGGGEPCCVGDRQWVCNENSPLRCMQTGDAAPRCVRCGNAGDVCCGMQGNLSCNPSTGIACNTTTQYCEACGGEGQQCCPGSGSGCSGGTVCNPGPNLCQMCGKTNTPCCQTGQLCEQPLVCNMFGANRTCQPLRIPPVVCGYVDRPASFNPVPGIPPALWPPFDMNSLGRNVQGAAPGGRRSSDMVAGGCGGFGNPGMDTRGLSCASCTQDPLSWCKCTLPPPVSGPCVGTATTYWSDSAVTAAQANAATCLREAQTNCQRPQPSLVTMPCSTSVVCSGLLFGSCTAITSCPYTCPIPKPPPPPPLPGPVMAV